MFALVAGCDALTSGLKAGVGSKECYETINEVSGSDEAERRNSHMELMTKHTKPKLATAEEWKRQKNAWPIPSFVSLPMMDV